MIGVNLDGLASSFTWEYDETSGFLNRLTYPNGMVRRNIYHPKLNLVASIGYEKQGNGGMAAGHEYQYDALTRPVQRRDSWDGTTPATLRDFTYNSRSELTGDQLRERGSYSYRYDNIGNRKTARELEEEVSYNANRLNQYTDITRNTEPFIPTYDADGNQTRIKTSIGIWKVSYDANDRPVIFTSKDGRTVLTCGYDYQGRRFSKKVTVNGLTASYCWFLYRGYLQVAQLDLMRPSYRLAKTYLWDPTEPMASRILMMTSWKDNGTGIKEHFCFMHDALKNVTSIFDCKQTRRARYEYAPLGALITAQGDRAQENKFRFSCEFMDDELGLIYYNYRYLNPTDGRWINRDPIDEQGGANLYAFSGNAVINKLDLLGLKPALMDDYDNATKFLKKEVSKHILAALSKIIKKANFKMLSGRQTVEHGGALFRKKTANSYSYKVSNHEAESKTYHHQPEVAPKNYCEVAIWHSHNIVFKHDGINEKTGFVLGGRLEGVFGPGSLSPEDERTGYGFVWANGHRVPKMDNPESVPAYVIQSTPKPARKALRLKTLDQDIKTQFSEEDFTAILVARQIDDPQSNKEANIVILDEHGKPLLPKPRPPKSGKTRH